MLVYPIRYAVWNLKGTPTALIVDRAVRVPKKQGEACIRQRLAIAEGYEKRLSMLHLFAIEYGIPVNKLLDYEAKYGL